MANQSGIKMNAHFLSEIAKSHEVQQICIKEADKIAERAAATAPELTGKLAGSYEVQPVSVNIKGKEHAGAQVRNRAGYSAASEFGTAYHEGSHTLAQATEAVT